jgi:CubicO group peptidase (beta-lactamase class C family)
LIGLCTLWFGGSPVRGSLPRSTPEKQGIPSAAILDFLQAADERVDAIHSFMLVRHGHVVAEGWWAPYSADTPHSMFSLSKSFTSTAVGLAIAEGKLSLDDPVLKFFPELAPAEPGENLRAMRVRDLLMMSTGQHSNEVSKLSLTADEHPTQSFLALAVEHKPGTHFYYNTPATYMQSAIVQKATGETILEFLRPRLFEPLGIRNPTWESSREGIALGGTGLSIRTEDIACFGQLYLQKGEWRGKQLVPSAWIEMATARQTSTGSNPASDWEQGYGFQFWRCRHGLYRGDGAFGQFCIVMPEQDAVVAITCGTRDMQGVMNLVWDKLLPAMRSKPLRKDAESQTKLQATLAGLTLHMPKGNPTSEISAKVSGQRFSFPTNDANIREISVQFSGKQATLNFSDYEGTHSLACDSGAWRRGQTSFIAGSSPRVVRPVKQSVAASGAWTGSDTYTAKLAYCETPLAVTFTLRFSDQQLFLSIDHSVQFGAARQIQLVGERQSR